MDPVKHSPHILLINPWITDFAAYNFWIKPLGLLYIASHLRGNGYRVTLIDCLDFQIKTRRYGDGNFFKKEIGKPLPVKSIPRKYSQYGIPEEILLKRFSILEEPDLIYVTSGMTYWYPGVFKIIEIAKKLFRGVPIILGGIYATLCYEHAKRFSGADIVFQGGRESDVLKLISVQTQFRNPHSAIQIDSLPYPAFDLYPRLNYVCLATSRGCPFQCTYCASRFLTQGFTRRDPLKVVDEMEYWTMQCRIHNIAFYDDALLINPAQYFIPIMKEVIKRGIHCNFHTPNALHIKEIDEEVADLLFRGGFKKVRLGLETTNEAVQIETGGKVDNQEFREAIKHLKRAGYSDGEIGVYIMAGLPGQRVGEVEESIAFVKESGAKPILVEYSPIPQTPLFQKAKQFSQFDIEKEPLFQNNSIFPCQWEGFTLSDFRRLKKETKRRSSDEPL